MATAAFSPYVVFSLWAQTKNMICSELKEKHQKVPIPQKKDQLSVIHLHEIIALVKQMHFSPQIHTFDQFWVHFDVIFTLKLVHPLLPMQLWHKVFISIDCENFMVQSLLDLFLLLGLCFSSVKEWWVTCSALLYYAVFALAPVQC